MGHHGVEQIDLRRLGARMPMLNRAACIQDDWELVVRLLGERLARNARAGRALLRPRLRKDSVPGRAGSPPHWHTTFIFDLLPGERAVVAHAALRYMLPFKKRVMCELFPFGIQFISKSPSRSAMSRNISKSVRASPGGATMAFTLPMRRSEFVYVPSFSPQIAAGNTKSAKSLVGVGWKPSCTTR